MSFHLLVQNKKAMQLAGFNLLHRFIAERENFVSLLSKVLYFNVLTSSRNLGGVANYDIPLYTAKVHFIFSIRAIISTF